MRSTNLLYSKSKLSNVVTAIERVKTTRSIEQQFLDELNMSIEKTDLENKREPSLTYKPSGMNCIRQSFYFLSGLAEPEERRSAASVGITESGTDRHDRIQRAINDMNANGFNCEYIDVETYINTHGIDYLEVRDKCGMETKVYDTRYNMSFMTDGIILYKGYYFIFEYKTEVSSKWNKRDEIDPKHYSQGTAYSNAFKIPRVLFIYENRDTCNKKAYLLNVTPEMIQSRIIDYVTNCNNYIQSKIVPPMPVNQSVLKSCQYCPYKGRCATDGPGSSNFNPD